MTITTTGRLTRRERYKRRIILLPRYFLHGIFFAILMNVLSFVWGPFLVPLLDMPLLLALIAIGAFLFFIIGTVNAFVTRIIWKLKMQFGLWTDFVHGLVFFIVLFLVSLGVSLGLSFILLFFGIPVASVAATILLVILLAFVAGYIGRAVAGIWEEY